VPGARPRKMRFTFAAVGRNEARTLSAVIAEAQRAARPGDRVWFVDSASTDDSIAIARELGVEVIEAPEGKGRAIAAALERCNDGYICLLDADQFHWTVNIPAALRAGAVATGADMVVGTYTDNRRRVIQPYIYWPLIEQLLPEYGRQCDPTPLSGLRVIDATLPLGVLPPGYGIETYLNLITAAAGRRIATTDLGVVLGPLRGYTNVHELAAAVGTTILDFAERTGVLEPAQRPEWDRWVGELIDAMATPPPPGAPDEQFLAELDALASRPFPPAVHADFS